MLFFRRSFLFVGLGLIGLSVLVLSWLPNPDIGNVLPVPGVLRQWVNANGNLRTAVPLLLLGGLVEGLLPAAQSSWHNRLWAWVALLVLVVLAEIGQLWLPKRHFDWGDIGYGVVGAAVGMGIVFVFKKILQRSSTTRL